MTTIPNPVLRCPRARRSTFMRGAAAWLAAPAIALGAPSAAMAACDGTCQAQFVSEHNLVRASVSNGTMPAPVGFQPAAVPALPAMSNDGTLAAAAQAWASACNFGHSGAANRGENITASTGTLTPADSVAGWANESNYYTYAATGDPVNTNQIVHYTQIAWANTTLVGCGIAHCTTGSPFGAGSPDWDFAVCQYSPAGNVLGQFPYTTSAQSGGTLDIDGDGKYDPFTDGLLVLRYLMGLRGTALVSGAVAQGATRSGAEIETYLQSLTP